MISTIQITLVFFVILVQTIDSFGLNRIEFESIIQCSVMKNKKVHVDLRCPVSYSSRIPFRLKATAELMEDNTKSPLAFFHELKARFQGDFDNFHQFIENEKVGLFPGEGGGHEHIHATIVPLSNQFCIQMAHLDQNSNNDVGKIFSPSLKTTDETMILYKNFKGQEQPLLPSHQMPSSPAFVLAAYYLDGVPSKIFRFRLYSLEPTTVGTRKDDPQNQTNTEFTNVYEDNLNVLLKIYTVEPKLMSEIRMKPDLPTQWETMLQQSVREQSSSDKNGEAKFLFQLLKGCNVLWAPQIDLKRHKYVFDSRNKDTQKAENAIDDEKSTLDDGSFHAIMLNETGAIVDSILIPGKKIRIQDELSLWGPPSSSLWINDRGFDVETGEFIYGNRRGIPYKMDRVASFEKRDEENNGKMLNRVAVKQGPGKDLIWTLGSCEEE